jgi:hypothetical protein
MPERYIVAAVSAEMSKSKKINENDALKTR